MTTKKAPAGQGQLWGAEVTTEGQRRLLETPGSEATIASRLGCGKAVVGHWRRGSRLPDEPHRRKLELLFAIPFGAWDVEPGAEVAASPAPATAAEGPPVDADDDILDITKQQIFDIREALRTPSLTEAAAAKLRDTLSKLLGLRMRLEAGRKLEEDRFVREHPEWTRIKAAILGALEPYPDAAAAVAEAVGEAMEVA